MSYDFNKKKYSKHIKQFVRTKKWWEPKLFDPQAQITFVNLVKPKNKTVKRELFLGNRKIQ